MSQKRVIRVLSYEGLEEWVDATLQRSISKTRFEKRGTISELFRVELKEGEDATKLLAAFNAADR